MFVADLAVGEVLQDVFVEDDAILPDFDERRPLVPRRRFEDRAEVLRIGEDAAGDERPLRRQGQLHRMDRLFDRPQGLDFVFLPNSDVGEYCPLVSP